MELKTLAILGSSGFIGNRLCKDLSNEYKIVRLNRNLKLKKKLKINHLICCSGPNKFWCKKNEKKILRNSSNFAKKIINFCKENDIKNLIYCSSIQVLKKNNNYLMPYIKWHTNIEKYFYKAKIKKKIIRLPNLFGKPEKNRKDLWNFFVNSIVKFSYLKKNIKVKNKPNQIIFAMPLNFFVKFLKKEINIKLINETKIINLNKKFKFRTDDLITLIEKNLKRKNLVPKILFENILQRKFVLKNIINKKEYLFFYEEMQSLIKFVKTK